MYCLKCKYDLQGLGESRLCPECGWRFNPDRPRTYRPSPDEMPVTGFGDSLLEIRRIFFFIVGFLTSTCIGFFVSNLLRGMGTHRRPAPGPGLPAPNIFDPRTPAYVLTVCAVLSALTLVVVAIGLWKGRFPAFLQGVLVGLLAAVVHIMVDLLMHM